MSHVSYTGPLHKWVPTSSNFRAAALAPSISPALNTGGGCSQRMHTGSVDMSPCFLEGPYHPMCIMVTSAFPWGEAPWGFSGGCPPWHHSRSGRQKPISPDPVWCTNLHMTYVMNQNTLRGGSTLQVTPWANHWELHTLVCGGKMSRAIFVRRPWLCWLKG